MSFSKALGLTLLLPLVFLLFVIEEQWGYRFTWKMEVLWLKEYILPLSFWTLGLGYYALVAGTNPRLRKQLLPYCRDLLLIHVGFLVILTLNQKIPETLVSKAFTFYTQAYGVLTLGILYFLGIQKMRAKEVSPLESPLACFPLSVLLLNNPIYGGLALVFALAIVLSEKFLNKGKFNEKNSVRWLLPAILLLGLLIRIFAAWRLGTMGDKIIITASDDGDSYFANAQKLLAGDKITNHHSMGASSLTALFYGLSGGSLSAAILIQSLFASILPLLGFFLARKLWSYREGLLGAFFIAFSQVAIFNSITLTRELGGSLFVILVLLSLFWLGESGKNFRAAWLPALVTGVLSALLVLFDIVFQPYLILIHLVMGFLSWKKKQAWTAWIFSLVILLTGGIAITGLLTGSFLARDEATLNELMTSYSYNGKALVAKHLHPIQFGLHPSAAFSSLFQNGTEGLSLILGKIFMDLKIYFFGGFLGGFDPLLFERHSLFASTLNFYLCVFIVLGLLRALYEMKQKPRRLALAMTVLLTFGHGLFYGVFLAGWARFRGTALPLLVLFLAAGILSLIPREKFKS